MAMLERERDELVMRAAAGEQERRLRDRAETLLQEQIAEVRRLEREQRESGGVPVEDGAALMRALARPVGQAAEHAARRLAAGAPQADDAKLLEFAAAFGKLAASFTTSAVTAADAESPAAPAPPAPKRTVEPEPSSECEPAAIVEQRAEEPPPAAVVRRRARRTAAFTVHPFGGAGEVGGSAIVVQTRAGHTVLLDAGQRVKGEYGLDTASPFHYSLPAIEALDAIVISHAHIDHIGSLPVLHSEYQRHRDEPLPVLMSEPTLRVGETMLRDSAKIQHKRQYLTSGHYAELVQSDFAPELDLKPAYGDAEINDVLDESVLHVMQTRQPFLIPNTNITVRLIPVAHVLGSCAVHLTDNDTGATLLYTGDLGPLTESQRTLPSFDGVNGFEPGDFVIMESTYARPTDNEHELRRMASREDNLQDLYKAARRAHEAGGKVLLPAFSLGRTQELLRIIEDDTVTGELPSGDVYIGGMGEKITEIYNDYKGSMWVAQGHMSRATEINRWLKDGIAFDEVVDDIVERDTFAYIIVSPAMLSGGWSRAFLYRMVKDERHAVVFTG
jgi:Cft2 family RNA processing exonuclease